MAWQQFPAITRRSVAPCLHEKTSLDRQRLNKANIRINRLITYITHKPTYNIYEIQITSCSIVAHGYRFKRAGRHTNYGLELVEHICSEHI